MAGLIRRRPQPLPQGFKFSAIAAGIKASGKADLALAECAEGTTAAAVFSRNRVVAAPLVVGRTHLRSQNGRLRALLVNAGNANCATGPAGIRDCQLVCRSLAESLGIRDQQVFPSSTGIIGVRLPVTKIVDALPKLLAQSQGNHSSLRRFSQAIMTTDTKAKVTWGRFLLNGRAVSMAGVAKGSGMIHPHMATMLAFVFTDIGASAAELKSALAPAVDGSFNCISVDGDMSTNDTVLLLASGKSGVALKTPAACRQFELILQTVCQSLAQQIVADGEGVKHVVRLRVTQARDRAEARAVADAIARSALVKTAWAGADPNWGRILAAIGASAIAIDPAKVDIFFGKQQVCRRGAGCDFDKPAAHRYLSLPAYEIRVALGRGKTELQYLTCDLTSEYVRINADYST